MRRDLLLSMPIAGFVLVLSGCLNPAAPTPAGDSLPASMKGYELYAWDDGGQTWFTLLLGTNRVKTPDEVFSGEREVIDPDGQFAITITGLDAVGGQLARLPRGAPVFVSTVRYPSGTALEVSATPESVARVLRQDATALGLDLQIMP